MIAISIVKPFLIFVERVLESCRSSASGPKLRVCRSVEAVVAGPFRNIRRQLRTRNQPGSDNSAAADCRRPCGISRSHISAISTVFVKSLGKFAAKDLPHLVGRAEIVFELFGRARRIRRSACGRRRCRSEPHGPGRRLAFR